MGEFNDIYAVVNEGKTILLNEKVERRGKTRKMQRKRELTRKRRILTRV